MGVAQSSRKERRSAPSSSQVAGTGVSLVDRFFTLGLRRAEASDPSYPWLPLVECVAATLPSGVVMTYRIEEVKRRILGLSSLPFLEPDLVVRDNADSGSSDSRCVVTHNRHSKTTFYWNVEGRPWSRSASKPELEIPAMLPFAEALLESDARLRRQRFLYVPSRMSESAFWSIYLNMARRAMLREILHKAQSETTEAPDFLGRQQWLRILALRSPAARALACCCFCSSAVSACGNSESGGDTGERDVAKLVGAHLCEVRKLDSLPLERAKLEQQLISGTNVSECLLLCHKYMVTDLKMQGSAKESRREKPRVAALNIPLLLDLGVASALIIPDSSMASEPVEQVVEIENKQGVGTPGVKKIRRSSSCNSATRKTPREFSSEPSAAEMRKLQNLVKKGDITDILFFAIQHGRVRSVHEILNAPENDPVELLRSVDADGATPLHRAVMMCEIDCVRTLLKFGASTSISMPNPECNADVDNVQRDNAEGQVSETVTAYELAHGVDALTTIFEVTFLQSLLGGETERIRDLLQSGMDPNAPMSGDLPLMWAAQNDNGSVIEVLYEGGAEFPMPGPLTEGSTPLHVAAKLGHGETLRALLKHYHIHSRLQDADGATVAEVCRNDTILRILQEASAVPTESGNSLGGPDNSRVDMGVKSESLSHAGTTKVHVFPAIAYVEITNKSFCGRHVDATEQQISAKTVAMDLNAMQVCSLPEDFEESIRKSVSACVGNGCEASNIYTGSLPWKFSPLHSEGNSRVVELLEKYCRRTARHFTPWRGWYTSSIRNLTEIARGPLFYVCSDRVHPLLKFAPARFSEVESGYNYRMECISKGEAAGNAEKTHWNGEFCPAAQLQVVLEKTVAAKRAKLSENERFFFIFVVELRFERLLHNWIESSRGFVVHTIEAADEEHENDALPS